MKSNTTAIIAASLLSLPILNAQDAAQKASDIAVKFEKQKAEALAAYIKDNPKAEDKTDASAMLVQSYFSSEQTEKAIPLLEALYETTDKNDLNMVMGGVVQPLIQAYTQTGKKEEAKTFIAKVKEDMASNPQAQQVNQFLDQIAGSLNQPAAGETMEIAFEDINGNKVDLAEMKDKVVLVDFWATWCGPCITEMPNVIKAHKAYKEKGFEIIGISLDQDKAELDKYLAANEAMNWPQYFDGKGWQSEMATKFGIQGIPATFLIGKDGKIVATNLRGEELESQLAELLK